MKRIIALLLILTMALGVALGETKILYRGPDDSANLENVPYESVRQVYGAGDVAYIRVKVDDKTEAIYTWREGMAEPQVLVPAMAPGAWIMEESELKNWAKTDPQFVADRWFAGDGVLYGLNHLRGTIFRVDEKDGMPVFSTVVTIADDVPMLLGGDTLSLLSRGSDIVLCGDEAIWIRNVYDVELEKSVMRVIAVSLKTGEGRLLDIPNVRLLYGAKEDHILVFAGTAEYDYDGGVAQPWTAYLYNVKTGEKTMLNDSMEQNYADQYYVPALDAFIEKGKTEIMGTRDYKESVPYAFTIPSSDSNRGMAVLGTSVLVGEGSRLYVYDLKENVQVDSKLVLGDLYTGDYTRTFGENHPDLPLVQVQVEDGNNWLSEMVWLMDGGKDAPDVVLTTLNSTPYYGKAGWNFKTLLEKGYCMDLSGYPQVAEYVAELYPVFRDAVMKDGKIYGLPVSAHNESSYVVNANVMRNLGLTMEDIPTNLVDLCAFITRWNQEFAATWPQYAPISCAEDYRSRIFDLMVWEYTNYCQAEGKELTFDDPIFREMMDALNKMEYDVLQSRNNDPNAELSDYRVALIATDINTMGYCYADLYSEDGQLLVLPMSATKDTSPRTPVTSMSVLIVNPRTDNADAVGELLSLYLEQRLHNTDRYALLSTVTEPHENADAVEQIAFYQEEIARLEDMLETAEGARIAAIIQNVQYFKSCCQNLESARWDLDPEILKAYQEVIVPTVFVREWSLFDVTLGAADALVNEFCTGQIDAETFITKADALMKEISK